VDPQVGRIDAGFVPANLHRDTLDGVIQVTEEDAFVYAGRSAREEDIFIRASSEASLAAVAAKMPDLADGARVLTFCYDTGERYLSVEGLFPGVRPIGPQNGVHAGGHQCERPFCKLLHVRCTIGGERLTVQETSRLIRCRCWGGGTHE